MLKKTDVINKYTISIIFSSIQ